MTTTPRLLPNTAGALFLDGWVHSHSAVRGDVAPDLHPLLRRFFDQLPTAKLERFAGWCAEAILISDRLYDAEAKFGHVSDETARTYLRGGQIIVVRVREPGDPAHGTPCQPCRSCAAMLNWYGVEAEGPFVSVVPDATPVDGTPTADPSARARNWAAELSAFVTPDGDRHTVVVPALDVFARYGGTRARADGPGERVAATGFVLDPRLALHTVATLGALGDAIGAALTPIGITDDGWGFLAIDEHGRVFVIDPTAEWWLGDHIDTALANLLHGRAPSRVREDGTWD